MSKISESKTRQLLIMRHGKADWEAKVDDLQRPMTARGIEEAKNVGHWLKQQALLPDIIVSSNASRALATSELVADAMGLSEITQDARIYNASIEQLLEVLADVSSQQKRVMLVGHNPGFEYLLLHLAEVDERFYQKGSLFTTGTVAVLDMPDDWQQLNRHCAHMLDIARGKDFIKAS